MTAFATLNSRYEIDQERKRIRRVKGVRPPTINQGTDGDWRTYQHLELVASGCLYIQWDSETATITSRVHDDDLPTLITITKEQQ